MPPQSLRACPYVQMLLTIHNMKDMCRWSNSKVELAAARYFNQLPKACSLNRLNKSQHLIYFNDLCLKNTHDPHTQPHSLALQRGKDTQSKSDTTLIGFSWGKSKFERLSQECMDSVHRTSDTNTVKDPTLFAP